VLVSRLGCREGQRQALALETGSSSTIKLKQNLLIKVVVRLKAVLTVLQMAVVAVQMGLAGTGTCQHGLTEQTAKACCRTSSPEKLQTDVSSATTALDVTHTIR
jgi:hypothetical protein